MKLFRKLRAFRLRPGWSLISALVIAVVSLLAINGLLLGLNHFKPFRRVAKQSPANLASEGSIIREILDENGIVIGTKSEELPSGSQMFLTIDGKIYAPQSLPAFQSPVEIKDQEVADLNTYVVEFKEPSVAETYTDKVNQGLSRSESAREAAAYKQELQQEHANYRASIAKTLGKKLGLTQSDKDNRQILQEYTIGLNGIAVELLPNEAETLKKQDIIKRVSEDVEVKTMLSESVPMIKANLVWPINDQNNLPITGIGVRIGIIDTGVDYTHADLGGCFGPGCKVIGGYDFVNKDTDPMDDHGHGTHVAATAAGKGALLGVAPNALIYAFKVMNAGGSGSGANVVAGVERCADPNNDGNVSDHLDVCSMSIGGSGNPDDFMSKAVDQISSLGVTFTIAAGNYGPNPETVSSPGCARSAITVGAACKPGDTNSYCKGGSIASFSSRGPVVWTDSFGQKQTMVKPDIVAPGVNICAAQWDSWYDSKHCLDTEHISISGTSMATPHLGGVVALLKQVAPNASPETIKTAIKQSAVPFSGYDQNTQGAGLVDTLAALSLLVPNLDFSKSFYLDPLFWNMAIDITKAQFSASKVVTVYNQTDQAQTFSLAPHSDVNGLTIASNITSLAVPAKGKSSFTASLTVDTKTIIGSQISNADITLTSPTKTLTFYVIAGAPQKINLPQEIEFDLDLPSNPSWSSTKTVTLANLQPFSQTYNVGVECCTNLHGGYKTSLITTSFSQPSITLPGNGQGSVNITASISDNTKVKNDTWEGKIIVSSPTQTPLYIPFQITKYFRIKVNYANNDIPQVIYLHNQNKAAAMISPHGTETGPAVVLLADKYPVLDITSLYWDSSDPYNLVYIWVVIEDHPFTGDDSVQIASSQATNVIKHTVQNRKGVNITKTLDGGFEVSGSRFTFKGTYVPAVGWGCNNCGPVTFRFNNVSSDYVFNYAASDWNLSSSDSKIWEVVEFNTILDQGISQSKTINYTANNLKYFPVFAYPHQATPMSKIYRYYCMSLSLTGRVCVTYPWVSIDAGLVYPDKNYRLDFYTYPISANSIINSRPGTLLTKLVLDSQIVDENQTNSRLYESDMTFVNEGILRLLHTRRPSSGSDTSIDRDYILDQGLYRFDPGVSPYNFNLLWRISQTAAKYEDNDGYASGYVSDQNGAGLWNDNGVYLTLYRNGTVVTKSLGLEFDLSSYIIKQPGSYEAVATKPVTIAGKQINHTLTTKFMMPSNYSPSVHGDLNPPTITRLRFLADGVPTRVIDPARNHTVNFSLLPNTLNLRLNEDSITQAKLRMKTNLTDWQELSVNQVSTENLVTNYSASIPVISNADLYTFEIYGQDSNNNSLTYTFEMPKGQVPGPGMVQSPIPSPSPSPTPPPANADANQDGKVDEADYAVWLSHYRQSTSNGPQEGDFNFDKVADGLDYAVWRDQYSGTSTSLTEPNPSPNAALPSAEEEGSQP